jgi:hypothetical protein
VVEKLFVLLVALFLFSCKAGRLGIAEERAATATELTGTQESPAY